MESGGRDVSPQALGLGVGNGEGLERESLHDGGAMGIEEAPHCRSRKITRVIFEMEAEAALIVGVRGGGLRGGVGFGSCSVVGLQEEGPKGRSVMASGQETLVQLAREVDVVVVAAILLEIALDHSEDHALEDSWWVGRSTG